MKIRLVCTDRGRHEPWRVGFVIEVMERQPTGAGVKVERDGEGFRTGYRLSCGRCPRRPLLSADATWPQLVEGLDAAGVECLDISDLPF